MKSKLSFLSMVIVTLSLLGLSCSKDVAADAAPESREPITFNVSNETITRGEIVTEINEFVVYAVDVDGAVIGNATFTKNDEGVWSPDNTLYWTGNEIKFYAYLSSSNFTAAEGTTLSYQMPTDVTAQDDLMVAQFTASSGAVTLSFERIMALIQFSVKDASYAVTSVAISGISDAGAYDMATKAWLSNEPTNASYTAGIDTTVADGGDEGTQITNNSGYLMVLPQSQTSITVTATNENGTEKVYTLANINWEAGKLYNYTINLEDIEPQVEEGGYEESTTGNDYTNKTDGYIDSNCYIIKSGSGTAQVYHLPIEDRINDYWTNYDNVAVNQVNDSTRGALTIDELWNDSGSTLSGIEVSLVLKDGKKVMQVKTEASFSTKCNAVYAVRNAAGTILWSWHLWLTDYAPITNYMDRYIGQKSISAIAGTTIYQFGRKDPIVKGYYTTGASCPTVSYSINNPKGLYPKYTSDYNWAGDLIDYPYYWGDKTKERSDSSTTKKSIFDPSPYGYRIPDYNNDATYMSNCSWHQSGLRYYSGSVNLYDITGVAISGYVFSLDTDGQGVTWTSQATAGYTGGMLNVTFWNGVSGSVVASLNTSSAYRYHAYPILPWKEDYFK